MKILSSTGVSTSSVAADGKEREMVLHSYPIRFWLVIFN